MSAELGLVDGVEKEKPFLLRVEPAPACIGRGEILELETVSEIRDGESTHEATGSLPMGPQQRELTGLAHAGLAENDGDRLRLLDKLRPGPSPATKPGAEGPQGFAVVFGGGLVDDRCIPPVKVQELLGHD